MEIQQQKFLFIELNRAWFTEEYNRTESQYKKESEVYDSLVNDVLTAIEVDIFQSKIFETAVKIQYPSGSQTLIGDSIIKYATKEIVLYDLGTTVWKHRYVLTMKAKTSKGIELVQQAIASLESHPSFCDVDEDMKIVGEIDNQAQQCLTC